MAELLLLTESESTRNIKEVKKALLFAEDGVFFCGLNSGFEHHRFSSSLCV